MGNTEQYRAGDQVLRSGTRPEIRFNGRGGRMPHVNALQALRIGRRAIEELGWIQGAQQTEDGACMAGAMVYAGPVPRQAFVYLAQAAGVEDWRRLDEWNDTPGRTVTDILDAYTMAEKFAREDMDQREEMLLP